MLSKPYATGKAAQKAHCSTSLVQKYRREGVVHPEVLSDGTFCYDDDDVRVIMAEKARRRPGRPTKAKATPP